MSGVTVSGKVDTLHGCYRRRAGRVFGGAPLPTERDTELPVLGRATKRLREFGRPTVQPALDLVLAPNAGIRTKFLPWRKVVFLDALLERGPIVYDPARFEIAETEIVRHHRTPA